MKDDEILAFIEEIAREAGAICVERSAELTENELSFKGTRDLVTEVDKEVERFIVERIRKRFPTHTIVGEEGGTLAGDSNSWVIDPIDGTVSYYHRQPSYAVSIAYMEEGVLQAGVVYAPALGQLFSASRGKGAWCNGDQRLAVSTTDSMINALLATGFACLRAGRKENNLKYLARILPQIRDIRRCGSAALDLAYVAAGKVDGFWEMDLNLYDVAAGVLLVQEAGGVVCDMLGGKHYPEGGIVAANPMVLERLLPHFSDFIE